MTIDEAKEARREMQREVLAAIGKFEAATELPVHDLDLVHTEGIGVRKTTAYVLADVLLS